MSLVIPDEILKASGWSDDELLLELVLLLFQQEKVSLGKAAELLNMSQISFQHLLASRDIFIHYDVAELQEDLGVHNDAATAQSFLESIGLPPDAEIHFASGFLLGWYKHATAAADTDLVKKWKLFKGANPFWE